MTYTKTCPSCGTSIVMYRNPVPTVDIIIDIQGKGIVLIERRNPPLGWALPGGFVDYAESVEQAAVREAFEETGLEVTLYRMLGVYSDPQRDPRHHTLSVVFIAYHQETSCLKAGDDAGKAKIFPYQDLPQMAFDHDQILADYKKYKEAGLRHICPQKGKSLCGR